MQEEKKEVFEVMDILRYDAPEILPDDTPQAVLDMMCESHSSFLLDVYLLAHGTPIRALLHPSMYNRIMKGWLRVGSIVHITNYNKDMIIEMETTGDISQKDLTRIKKEAYITLPTPLYNPNTYYVSLLSEFGYLKWDRRWKRYLPEYTEDPKNEEALISMKSNQITRKNTQNNFVVGQVILKSKIFGGIGKRRVALLFCFVLRSYDKLIKVYVWEKAVRKFFCIKEGDYVAINGFKIKRAAGIGFYLADRMKTDLDTKYSDLFEISVNTTEPCGNIMLLRADLIRSEDLIGVENDEQFTTVRGTVEYVSPLIRERIHSGATYPMELVYIRVSGQAVKLCSNGCANDILGIKAGASIEIRHLRKGRIGDNFVFYISSVYTQFYSGKSDAPLFDKNIIEGESQLVVEENAMGYIPVCYSAYVDHIKAKKEGIGYLTVNGIEFNNSSHNTAYIKKDAVYFGEVVSIANVRNRTKGLCMDESIRLIVFGKIMGVRYGEQEEGAIDEGVFDVSYVATDLRQAEEDIVDKIEENILIRVGNEENHINVQVFQNHLVHKSFKESVMDFLKIEGEIKGSVYEEAAKRLETKCYVVIDAVRVNEEVVMYIGVSILNPPVENN